jgi:hypothetical protein
MSNSQRELAFAAVGAVGSLFVRGLISGGILLPSFDVIHEIVLAIALICAAPLIPKKLRGEPITGRRMDFASLGMGWALSLKFL